MCGIAGVFRFDRATSYAEDVTALQAMAVCQGAAMGVGPNPSHVIGRM